MNTELATFGSGCFWCTEAIFQNLKGVSKVISGYMGGHQEHPTYEDVCTGSSGHAEVIQVEYDSEVISFEELLLVFFKTHNPTTLNRQGNDVGTQYRSAIFYHSPDQKTKSMEMIDKLEKSLVFENPIVTEIAPVSEFYNAEDYHQNYFNQNSSQPYCSFVIQPKLNKFEQDFKDRIKS